MSRRLETVAGHLFSGGSYKIHVSAEVRDALARGVAVVALESTIVTHGMPYPKNLETALEVEDVVRQAGAVPATIAIIKGEVRVGLSRDQITYLAKEGHKVNKCSRRDIAFLCSQGLDGSTTVSATLFFSHSCGIRVFVTGGIGGVHRDARDTYDISADLIELGKTPDTVVVCSGVKSILDIAATLEVLETQGVTVATLGQRNFPAFFTGDSGYPSPMTVGSVEEVARMLEALCELHVGTSMLLAVPIPKHYEAQTARVEQATQQALQEAAKKKVQGRDVTPFLLGRIAELTGEESLQANIALIKNNAKIGSQLAVAFQKQLLDQRNHNNNNNNNNNNRPNHHYQQRGGGVVSSVHFSVVGGAVEDLNFTSSGAFVEGESNIGTMVKSDGGVARNVCEALARVLGNSKRTSSSSSSSSSLSSRIDFVTCVGDDESGHRMLQHLQHLGVVTDASVRIANATTATYGALFSGANGDLIGAVASMGIFEKHGSYLANQISSLSHYHHHPISNSSNNSNHYVHVVVMDCNFDAGVVTSVASKMLASSPNVHIWIDPTSQAKCVRALDAIRAGLVYGIAPNEAEFATLVSELSKKKPSSPPQQQPQSQNWVQMAKELFSYGVQVILLKLGVNGVKCIIAERDNNGVDDVSVVEKDAPRVEGPIVSVSGCGDVLLASTLAARYCGSAGLETWSQILDFAQGNVAKTLLSSKAVPENLETI